MRVHTLAKKTEALTNYITIGSIARAARESNVDPQTLRKWVSDEDNAYLLNELRDRIMTELVEASRAVALLAVEKVREKLESGNVSAKDAGILFGIASDKIVRFATLPKAASAVPMIASPDKAEALAREILRINQEMDRRASAQEPGESDLH